MKKVIVACGSGGSYKSDSGIKGKSFAEGKKR